MAISRQTRHGAVLVSGDLLGDGSLFKLGDEQGASPGASPFVRNRLVAEEDLRIWVPARPAWASLTFERAGNGFGLRRWLNAQNNGKHLLATPIHLERFGLLSAIAQASDPLPIDRFGNGV